jgi:hypothetical protein
MAKAKKKAAKKVAAKKSMKKVHAKKASNASKSYWA